VTRRRRRRETHEGGTEFTQASKPSRTIYLAERFRNLSCWYRRDVRLPRPTPRSHHHRPRLRALVPPPTLSPDRATTTRRERAQAPHRRVVVTRACWGWEEGERLGGTGRRMVGALGGVMKRLGLLAWENSVPPLCASLLLRRQGTIHPLTLLSFEARSGVVRSSVTESCEAVSRARGRDLTGMIPRPARWSRSQARSPPTLMIGAVALRAQSSLRSRSALSSFTGTGELGAGGARGFRSRSQPTT